MEPASSGAAGFAGFKVLSGLAAVAAIGAGVSAIVAMCMMTPRSPREWAMGLITTVMASVTGGAAFIQYFNIQHWIYSPIGCVALIGVVFACGLPGWAIVRWVFNYISKRQDATITEVMDEMKKMAGR